MGAWLLVKLASRTLEWYGLCPTLPFHLNIPQLILHTFQVKKILVPKRENPIINRLNKTKVEKFPDLNMEKVERLQAQAKKNQAAMLARVSSSERATWSQWSSETVQKKEEAQIAKERREMKYQKEHAYDDIFTEENMGQSSNQNRSEDFLDDFM